MRKQFKVVMTNEDLDDSLFHNILSAPPAKEGGKWRVPVKILIADESSATLNFFSRLLEDRGFETHTAESGEKAWELLMQHHFSAILLGDLMRPPIDGLDLIRRLRHRAASIVIATSYGADYVLLAKMAGAQTVLHKFADPAYLATTIEQVISRQPAFPAIPRR